MRHYSVMLVDDEEMVRQAIVKKLNWAEMGFEVIAVAANGEEALQLAEKLRPDVVMTDIKMPFMDGLTFCHKLKENQKSVKIVIFSGFNEFDYAKEAIKLEVEEYILKPVDSSELRNVFERLKGSLDREIHEKRNFDKLRDYYVRSLPVMREQFVVGLLEGRISSDKVEEMNRSYELNIDAPFYGVAVFKTDMNGEGNEEMEQKRLLNLSLKQIAQESLKDIAAVKSFIYLDEVVVIIPLKTEELYSQVIWEIDQVCKTASRVLEVTATAGIGQLTDTLGEITKSYKGAMDAVDYRVIIGTSQAIYIRDIQPALNNDYRLDDQDVQKLLKDIKLGDKTALQKDVDTLVMHLQNINISLTKYQAIMMEIITELLKLGRSYRLDLEKLFGEQFQIYRDIREFDSLNSLGQWLYQTCLKLSDSIHWERVDSTRVLVDKARQYIDEHYSDAELSVDVLCEQLSVSAAYFSTIFKKGAGKSFVSYLTMTRMEAALQLLNNTEDKTYIIAGKVGYTEPNYFSYVFKKYYGISPSKYRTGKLEKHEKES